jgi:hypothetical protein
MRRNNGKPLKLFSCSAERKARGARARKNIKLACRRSISPVRKRSRIGYTAGAHCDREMRTRDEDRTPMNKSSVPASVVIMAGVAALCGGLATAADQNSLVANAAIDGPALAFDWPAIEVGIGSYQEGPTGVTVIRFPKRASVAVDVRGGGPGTVNTDLLRLGHSRPFTDAIVFSGG